MSASVMTITLMVFVQDTVSNQTDLIVKRKPVERLVFLFQEIELEKIKYFSSLSIKILTLKLLGLL